MWHDSSVCLSENAKYARAHGDYIAYTHSHSLTQREREGNDIKTRRYVTWCDEHNTDYSHDDVFDVDTATAAAAQDAPMAASAFATALAKRVAAVTYPISEAMSRARCFFMLRASGSAPRSSNGCTISVQQDAATISGVTIFFVTAFTSMP